MRRLKCILNFQIYVARDMCTVVFLTCTFRNLAFMKVRSFWRAKFNNFWVINQNERWPTMPHSDTNSTLTDKPLSLVAIYRGFKKLEDKISGKPCIYWQRGMRRQDSSPISLSVARTRLWGGWKSLGIRASDQHHSNLYTPNRERKRQPIAILLDRAH